MSFLIAAPASGHGKTILTLGILAQLSRLGCSVRAAKSGPDYIDPQFHHAACGQPCLNLDAWAMPLRDLHTYACKETPIIVEGAMGLFDGAAYEGQGSCAALARILDIPVVLVIDVSKQAHSIAALVYGFLHFDPQINIAGVVLNNVGSARHETMLRHALKPLNVQIFGAIARQPSLNLPERHLGLVQAHEHPELQSFLAQAADVVRDYVDVEGLLALLHPLPSRRSEPLQYTPPAQTIAVAQDPAFSFAYTHLLQNWQAAGATVKTFSPLNDDAVPDADLIYLPGGYPELHAGQLSGAQRFMSSLRSAAQKALIYGECGGYMALGEALIDAQGNAHQMAGLLPLATSFQTRRRQLGYRKLNLKHHPDLPQYFQGPWRGHEFHYATTSRTDGPALFEAKDSADAPLAEMGLRHGRVFGSFAHLISPY